jgi:predicted nucleic acid-binding Zn ribbon protein
MSDSEDDPEIQRKARRAIRLLYFLTATLILLPVVLWWFFKR